MNFVFGMVWLGFRFSSRDLQKLLRNTYVWAQRDTLSQSVCLLLESGLKVVQLVPKKKLLGGKYRHYLMNAVQAVYHNTERFVGI